MDEEGIADGLVDDAVEDVCEEFALEIRIWSVLGWCLGDLH